MLQKLQDVAAMPAEDLNAYATQTEAAVAAICGESWVPEIVRSRASEGLASAHEALYAALKGGYCPADRRAAVIRAIGDAACLSAVRWLTKDVARACAIFDFARHELGEALEADEVRQVDPDTRIGFEIEVEGAAP